MKLKVFPYLILGSLFLQSCGGSVKIKSTRGDTYRFKKENVSCDLTDFYLRCEANGTVTDLSKKTYPYYSRKESCFKRLFPFDPEDFSSIACAAAKKLGVYEKMKPIKFVFSEARWDYDKQKYNPNAKIEDFDWAENIEGFPSPNQLAKKRELALLAERKKRELEEKKRLELELELEEKKRRELAESISGIGIGVEEDEETDFIRVAYVKPGLPAKKAFPSLFTGDLITAIDGKSTKGMTAKEATNLIVGPPGTQVTLSIKRTYQFAQFPTFTNTYTRVLFHPNKRYF